MLKMMETDSLFIRITFWQILTSLFAIYMVVLFIIFEKYYKPDVLQHFREDLEQVHSFRTSNMTVSISSRFEAFYTLSYDNVAKI